MILCGVLFPKRQLCLGAILHPGSQVPLAEEGRWAGRTGAEPLEKCRRCRLRLRGDEAQSEEKGGLWLEH